MLLNSGKSGCIRAKLLYLDKVGWLGQSGLFRTKVVLFGKEVVFRQKWLYSGKSGFIRAKDVVLGQIVVIRQI